VGREENAMLIVDDAVRYLDEFAPHALAADWDNVGLLLGDRTIPVRKIMTCLTVTPESAAEAVAEQAQLVVTHHPIFFRPVKRLTTANPEGRMVLSLIQSGVAVYCPHTAFDNARDGINEMLALRLGLAEVRPLRPRKGEAQCKIVVFVPEADLLRVSNALFEAGAGNIGQYSQCSFRLAGTGTFFGSEASNPTLGQKGRREEVAEWRLEAVCPEATVERAIAAIRRSHSYEEPAYDLYPLRSSPSSLGEGRLGRLSTPVSLEALARRVKAELGAELVQTVGNWTRPVNRVAIVCGAGGEFVADATRAEADVLLTGEARFHDCLAAEAMGLAMILPGHYATERPGVETLANRLALRFPDLHVWASRREANPLRLL
jgi:dinuclear metal center YbgI/SA1388 family protein